MTEKEAFEHIDKFVKTGRAYNYERPAINEDTGREAKRLLSTLLDGGYKMPIIKVEDRFVYFHWPVPKRNSLSISIGM